MFEAQVAYYLNKYLGKYLQGLDADSLRISVWRGDVELRNLSLRPEALQDLDLPVTVKAGLLGRLTLKVPWTALGREPVVVEFDRLYLLACPKDPLQPAQGAKVDVSQYEAEVAAGELSAKRQRVLAAETQWLQELQAKMALKAQQLQQQQQQQGQGQGGTPKRAGGGGLFNINLQALIHTILGNLQLRLTNVHIRYEDSCSLPGQLLSGGLLLGRVSAHTVDEKGREAFVTADVLNLLRKAIVLQDFGVYFDVGSPFMDPPKDWASLNAREWDMLLSPARHAPAAIAVGGGGGGGGGSGGPQYRHHFLLLPISGQMNYVRRSTRFLSTSQSSDGSDDGGGGGRPPRQEGRIALRALSLALSREQYVGARALLEALDDYTANAPYRAMRPHCRPTSGADARVWWRYALFAVQKQLRLQRGGGCSWAQLQTACRLRKKYIPAYARCLTAAAAAAVGAPSGTGATTASSGRGGGGGMSLEVVAGLGGDDSIGEMDAQLPEGTILLFRRMAHAMAQSQKPAAATTIATTSAAATLTATSSTTDGAQGRVQTRTSAAGGGWVGWLMRGKRPPAAAAPVSATLTPEEWDRLQQLLLQEDVEDVDAPGDVSGTEGDGGDGPYFLSALLEVAVERCSLQLDAVQGGVAQPLISASMQAVGIRILRYPTTLGVSLRVGWAGLESPNGVLLCTGQLSSSNGLNKQSAVAKLSGKGSRYGAAAAGDV
ncbi:hypothetical protein Vafri_18864, partial [Volvox africanus]